MKKPMSRKLVVLAGVMALVTILTALPVSAGGTEAGTVIENSATVNYVVSGVAQEVIESSPSGNSTPGAGNGVVTDFTVDEKVDLTVVTQDAAAVAITPGGVAHVLTFSVTNNGNKVHDYGLSAIAVAAGGATKFDSEDDDFDMNNVNIYVDSNANGTYESGTDTVDYIDELVIDDSVTVFIVSDAPLTDSSGDPLDGKYASYHLLATAREGNTPGSLGDVTIETDDATAWSEDSVQIVFADSAGTAGSDDERDGKHSDLDDYKAVSANITVTKTVEVVDDGLGIGSVNPKAIPGATIKFTITVTNNGSAAADNIEIQDVIPTNMSYDAATIQIDGTGMSDGDDGDEGAGNEAYYDGGTDSVNLVLGTLDFAAGSNSSVITFQTIVE